MCFFKCIVIIADSAWSLIMNGFKIKNYNLPKGILSQPRIRHCDLTRVCVLRMENASPDLIQIDQIFFLISKSVDWKARNM